ncbi:MAG TPA: SsrA-binding protein SmpB, partial [Candidatus Baltobacteraceae bacterium]|nr:SsrA-binding protein SmpB [Candidatus Baltobacteraceae bacterium]
MDDLLAANDRARYDYEILDKYEAGLVLTGQETKSAKTGHMKLKGAHVAFTRGEAMLLGSHIAKYPKAGPLPDYDPERSRKLLLHKRELERLRGKREEEGLTIVPLRAYMKAGRIKLEIAVARGKKQFEKRETIKKR